VQHPGGAVDRLRGYLDKREDRRAWEQIGQSPTELYQTTDGWAQPLHDMLAFPEECDEVGSFEPIWEQMTSTIGVQGIGEQSHAKLAAAFDANLNLLRALWCAVRHTRPDRVVETGVARGITSRVLLEALSQNDAGHLWSIDLPHPANYQLGIAVTPPLKSRWSLQLGTSKALLPGLLDQLGEIDLFVHDSLHTARNVEFELRRAWGHLRPGGLLLADDVHQNLGFHRFVTAENVDSWFVAPRADSPLMWGVARKR
jgi:hypothetical protein